jgi:lichenan operon transcriptional antiterminator
MRPYEILKALIEAKGNLPITFFMDIIKASKRTIQNEISYLRKMGGIHGFVIHSAYGKGYSLEVTNKDLLAEYMQWLKDSAVVIDEEQLLFDELSLLIQRGNRFVSVNDIADELGYSRTLLFEKMRTVTGYLGTYALSLERKSHYGIRIKGESRRIRQLMADMYMRGDNDFKTFIDERVGNFDEFERVVQDSIQENRMRIGYYEFQTLMTWLKVLIAYASVYQPVVTIGHTCINAMDASNPLRTNQLGAVLLKIQKTFHITVSEEEAIEYQSLVRHSAQSDEQTTNQVDSKRLRQELANFFKETDAENDTDYSTDKEFIDQLTKHLMFLIDRLDQNITYKNPLLLELCIRYPMVFDVVLKFSTFLQKAIGFTISNDELGFIAVHFLNHYEKEKHNRLTRFERVAVICTTGGGVSNLVKMQIEAIFPNSQVKAFSFWEESHLSSFHPDLVFSVVPLKHAMNVPTIYIRELLSRKDIDNIKQVLFLKNLPEVRTATVDTSTDYLNLIRSELFQVVSANSYLQLIKEMANRFIETGYASAGFEEKVLQREQYMSTVYRNGIAIPHPIEMTAQKSAIGVTIVKNKLVHEDKEVKLIFMVNFAENDFHFYSQLSSGLFQLMQNPAKISAIYNHPVLPEVINAMKGMEG